MFVGWFLHYFGIEQWWVIFHGNVYCMNWRNLCTRFVNFHYCLLPSGHCGFEYYLGHRYLSLNYLHCVVFLDSFDGSFYCNLATICFGSVQDVHFQSFSRDLIAHLQSFSYSLRFDSYLCFVSVLQSFFLLRYPWQSLQIQIILCYPQICWLGYGRYFRSLLWITDFLGADGRIFGSAWW